MIKNLYYYYKKDLLIIIMSSKDRFLCLMDYVDSSKICDMLQEYLDDYQLKNFCEFIEDELNIQYENNYIDLEDSDL